MMKTEFLPKIVMVKKLVLAVSVTYLDLLYIHLYQLYQLLTGGKLL